jgi:hypothetical protein
MDVRRARLLVRILKFGENRHTLVKRFNGFTPEKMQIAKVQKLG